MIYNRCGPFSLTTQTKMTIRTFLLLTTWVLLTSSCSSTSIKSIKGSNDLEFSIGYFVNAINDCINGANSINIDDKAIYDNRERTLIIYRGESVDNFYQKWEIPLRELDPSNIKFDNSEIGGNVITVYTIGKNEKIRYYKEGQFISFTSENNYYLGQCLSREKDKSKVIESYRRAIILSKN